MYRPDQQYVFLGYSNGILRLHKLYLENDEVLFDGPFLKWSLDNYWLITLHDAKNGAIRDIYPIGLVFFPLTNLLIFHDIYSFYFHFQILFMAI